MNRIHLGVYRLYSEVNGKKRISFSELMKIN